MTVTVEAAVAAYMKLRAQKTEAEARIKDEVTQIEANMGKIEAWIKTQADALGVSSFKTKHGTAFLITKDYANVADWDATLSFIKETGAFDMLNKAVNKTAVRGYIEQNKTVPPGVNYGTKVEVNVRKPTAKVED
jgi:hypothetical protein